MPIAKIRLDRLRYNSDTPGTNDAYEVSRVEFTLELAGRESRGLIATIKQPAEADYRTVDLEVSRPLNYHGPFNFFAFRNAVEAYYRDAMAARHAREGRDPKFSQFIYDRGLTFECEVGSGE